MQIAEKLNNAGFHIWYDKNLEAGKPFDDDIADHIKACSVFILFVSKHYLKSPYCDRELKFAAENDRNCFAVYLDKSDLSERSGMALFLRTPNNLYKCSLSDEEFYGKLFSASMLEESKRKEDEEDLDLSVREIIKPVPVFYHILLCLLYLLTAFAFLLRSVSVSSGLDNMRIIGKDIYASAIITFIHIVLLIAESIFLYRTEKQYTHFVNKSLLFSAYLSDGIILNFNLMILPLINNSSAIIQVLVGFLMAILTLIPISCCAFDQKTMPCTSINLLNASMSNLISIFLTLLLLRNNFRWTAFVLLLWTLIYPGMAIMEKNQETKETKKYTEFFYYCFLYYWYFYNICVI